MYTRLAYARHEQVLALVGRVDILIDEVLDYPCRYAAPALAGITRAYVNGRAYQLS